MISFACTSVDIRDIVMCSFDITKTEYELLFSTTNEARTINDIAGQQRLERSTVQKAIARLHQKELLQRHQRNLSTGGYQYVYSAIDRQRLKDRLLKAVDGWHKNVVTAVDRW